VFDFGSSIERLTQATEAAADSNAPLVIQYVRDVHSELRGEPVAAGA
jgi:hypothetical protein